MSLIKILARVCLSGIFIVAGYGAYSQPGGRPKALPKIGLPESEDLVKLNGATMVGAGIMLGLGIFPKLAALTLIGALVPTTLAGHAFWKETETQPKKNQLIQFCKNLGLIGGLLLVLADRKKQAS
jgi:uncharacterized membrane protein YphA (DoxX/SURF4 family)